MKFARIIAMLLLVAMCLSMVIACKDDSGDGSATPTTPNDQQNNNGPSNGDSDKFVKDKVPDANYDKTINIRCWDQSTNEYDVELTESSDDVDEALYNRNRKVEERLGVELKYLPIPGNTYAVTEYNKDVHTSIDAKLGLYDIVSSYSRCAGTLAAYGDFVNLYNVDHIDTDMPWWPVEVVDTNTIGDKLVVATGDIATSLIYCMQFLVINQEYAEEFNINIDELQALALDGGWTFDYMLDLTANRWQEDDNTVGKSKDDRFGLHIRGYTHFETFYQGAGLKYTEPTYDGTSFEISDDYIGKESKDMLQKLSDAFRTDSYFYGTSTDGYPAGKSLVYAVTGDILARDMRSALFTYRVLPAPKYYADEEYYTGITTPHSLYAIPKDAKDKTISGAVFEVMASESHRQVTPVLFDKVFLYKLTNDELDMAILNLIRDRSTHDLARTFFEPLGGDTNGPVRVWNNLCNDMKTNVEYHYNMHLDRWNSVLKTIYDTISSIED